MTEEAKKERVLRNPSPEELEALNRNNAAIEAVPDGSKEELSLNKVEDIQMEKPDESSLSPKKVSHTLICGAHNYQNIPQLAENGSILIRRMGAFEEAMFQDFRKSRGDMPGFFLTLNQVLENCIRTNISIYDLYMQEQLWLFFHVFALTYGEVQEFKFMCPICGLEETKKINILKDVNIAYLPKKKKIPTPVKLKTYGSAMTMYCKYPKLDEQQTYIDPTVDAYTKLRLIVDRIEGVMPNGDKIEPKDYEEIIRFLDSDDIDAINTEVASLGSFGIELSDITVPDFCTNRKCSAWMKPQKVIIPLDQMILKFYR